MAGQRLSRFVRLKVHDPYVTFATTLHRLQPAIERAYYAAFAASDASNEALKAYQRETFSEPLMPAFTLAALSKPERSDLDPEELYADALAEDAYCDMQATIVVLFADDLLQRFGYRVLGEKVGLQGYGPLYRGVRLTTLLRATTNCVRHVSEWEDYPFPYRSLKDAESNNERIAINNIAVLQEAYGLGKHEPIRDFVTWHTVVTIDGLYGTHPPDYGRFSAAIVAGATAIAEAAGGSALNNLKQALSRE